MRYTIPAYHQTSRLDAVTTNRVLRNSYILLSITLLPTIVGAYFGVLFPLMMVSPILGFVAFLAAIFGLQYMVIRNRERPAGIAWLLLFTFVMGYFVGPLVGIALNSYSNGLEMVTTAIGGTAAIFFGMAGYATVTKRDFSQMSLGKVLFIGMWMMFVMMIVNMFLQSTVVGLAISSVVILIMSTLILYTINRVVRGGESNYIMVTMTLYIALLNIFQSLLHLLMAFAGNRE